MELSHTTLMLLLRMTLGLWPLISVTLAMVSQHIVSLLPPTLELVVETACQLLEIGMAQI